MSTEALLSKTVSVKIPRSARASGSRVTKQLETVAMRVIAATESFYFARGIGLQALGVRHWTKSIEQKKRRENEK